jgi:predicted DNA repair protein MutK
VATPVAARALGEHVPASDFAIEAILSQGVLGAVLRMLADLMVGVIVGAVVSGVVKLIGMPRASRPQASA